MSYKKTIIEDTAVPIREFDLKLMRPNPSICMIAKRGSGKSWVCRSLLEHFKHIPVGLIISPTDRMSNFYGKFFPESYIHYEYNSEIIEKLLYRQTKIIEKMKKKYKKNKKCDPRAILLMDDCLSSKGKWTKDQGIMQLFYDGRHYQITYILTMQFPLGLKPELRSNFDYIFLLADDFFSNQQRLYNHYAGMFPNFNSFRQVFLDLTEDYGCMLIVNSGARKSFLDKIYYYKSKNVDIKKIGCKQFNDFHKQNYNTEWKTNKQFDIKTILEKKNSNIQINKKTLN